MSHTIDLTDPRAQQILALEKKRQDAYLNRDFASLGELFSDDVSYVHSDGRVEDTQTYLANVTRVPNYFSLERDQLKLRFIGNDAAILSGTLRTHFRRANGEEARNESYVSQVWERHGDSWRQVHYQLTRPA